MQIAIINITGGSISGGYRKYLCNVLPRLASNPNVEFIICAVPPNIGIKSCFDANPNVAIVSCRPVGILHRGLDLELKRLLDKFSPDVIFVPVERIFRFKNFPVVNMLQNMEPFVYNNNSNTANERFKNWIRYFNGKWALKKADRVIAISNFVRDYLINECNIEAERIGLIYHGIENNKIYDIKKPSSIPDNLKSNFLFTAGSIRPARGLEDVIYAIKYLLSKNIDIPTLFIAGSCEPGMTTYYNKLQRIIIENGLKEKIIWTGVLNEQEMLWCYRNCRIFIMTSRVESFGQIALEAMSNGCVSISSDSPCLPEIFDDAAIFYTSRDGNALAEAIKMVIKWDGKKRKEMSEKAKKRASEFSWDITVEKLVKELFIAIENKK